MKTILKIAFPAMLESVLAVVVTSIDTKMISVLGKEAVSAVSFTAQPRLFVFAVFTALGTTTSVFVAQALGKGDSREANACFHLLLKMTTILSLILGFLTGVFAGPIMHLCNRQVDTVDLSVTFFRIIMPCLIFQNVSAVLNAALRGIGKTKVPLMSGIAMAVVDVLANYLLIEGHLGFPRLGVAGDAVATVCGTIAACGISIYYLLRNPDFLNMKGFLSGVKPEPDLRKAVRSKARKVIVENLMTRLGFLLSGIIVSTLASSETAVFYVAMILPSYTFAFGDGLQSAAVTLVGSSLGAERYKELNQYARKFLTLALVVSAVLSIVYISGSGWFFSRFFQDAESINMGVSFSYVTAVLTFMQIIRIVNVGIMRGSGDVRTPMIMATVCVLLINPGSSFLMTAVFPMGIWGIWNASVVTQGIWLIVSLVKSRQLLAGFRAMNAVNP